MKFSLSKDLLAKKNNDKIQGKIFFKPSSDTRAFNVPQNIMGINLFYNYFLIGKVIINYCTIN
jgi:hypothetical protein